jgi:hypothetical protein
LFDAFSLREPVPTSLESASTATRSLNIELAAKEVVKQLGADLSVQEGARVSRGEPAMADKPEFVDLISEATQQRRRRVMPRVVRPVVKETSRLSHWPPGRWLQWRLETFTSWKLKAWKFKNWD